MANLTLVEVAVSGNFFPGAEKFAYY